HMAFWVIAETPAQFSAWMAHQLQPAVEPPGEQEKRGREVFLKSACVLCHATGGADARARAGRDRTHFGSRKTIAAGTLFNTKGNLAGWIADPQNIKPGTHMATVPIQPAEMQPLVDYLETLKLRPQRPSSMRMPTPMSFGKHGVPGRVCWVGCRQSIISKSAGVTF